jgi:mannose-6-phosphate isomerase-like protein (cupin superfamily)
MKRILSTAAMAAAAFAGGLLTAHELQRADAASPPLKALVVNVAALNYADLPPSKPGTLRKQMFVDDGEGMTMGVYIGPTPKHYHAKSNEFQYIVKGSGREWFGAQRLTLKPGMLLIIPKGMPHGGVTGDVSMLEMKSPPQDPDDNHRIK